MCDRIINAIQVYLQMLSPWLLFFIKHTLWLRSAPSAANPTTDKPACLTLACALPLETPRADSRMTFGDLVIFMRQYQIATTAPPAPSTAWPGSETAIHTLQENYGPLSRIAATWIRPRKPLCCSRFLLSLTDEAPTPSLSFPFCRSQSATTCLC